VGFSVKLYSLHEQYEALAAQFTTLDGSANRQEESAQRKLLAAGTTSTRIDAAKVQTHVVSVTETLLLWEPIILRAICAGLVL